VRVAVAATVLVAILAILATGCDAAEGSPPPIVLPLKTIEKSEDAPGFGCAGVGLAAVVRGNPADPDIAWLAPYPGALVGAPPRRDVLWPAGYRAMFSPGLTIIDAKGAPRLRDGDFVDGACVIGGDGLLILPAGDGFALECGPMNVPECTSGRVSQAARKVGEAANGRRVAVIRFVNDSGKFQVIYEDGSTGEGFTSSL